MVTAEENWKFIYPEEQERVPPVLDAFSAPSTSCV